MEPDSGRPVLPPDNYKPVADNPILGQPTSSSSPASPRPAPSWPSTIPQPGTTNKKKRGLKVLMIAIVAVVVLGAAGAFAYLGVYVPNQPENIVKTAVAKFIASNSAEFQGELELKFGDYTISPSFNFKSDVEGDAAGSIELKLPDFSFSAELLTADNDVYFKLKGISELAPEWEGYLLAFGFDPALIGGITEMISALDGQWLVTHDAINEKDLRLDVPKADQDELLNAFKDREIVTIAEELGEESIDGRKAVYYKLTLNEDEIKAGIESLNIEVFNEQAKKETLIILDEYDFNNIDV